MFILLRVKLSFTVFREAKWFKESIYSLHKISSILRDNQDNCLTLSKTGFTLSLLTEFGNVLSKDDPKMYGKCGFYFYL